MITQVRTPRQRQRFRSACRGKLCLGITMPQALELFGKSQPGRFFAGPTLALDVGGSTAWLAGHANPDELASFLHFCGCKAVILDEAECPPPTGWVIEDDPTIAQTLKNHLEGWDYKVECAKDFHNITAEFAAFDPQLVLLDIKLPFYDGYYWCGEIRKLSKVPVIFLSSASDNMNVVMAMNMGGDDFIAKPFDLSVLTAKINAVLRRAYSFSGNSDLISHGSVILDISSAVVTNGDKKAELTKNELRILRTLMENAGRIISRDTLMQRLWETDCFIDENTLTVNVSRLRKKLENIGLENYIATKVGMGYMIV